MRQVHPCFSVVKSRVLRGIVKCLNYAARGRLCDLCIAVRHGGKVPGRCLVALEFYGHVVHDRRLGKGEIVKDFLHLMHPEVGCVFQNLDEIVFG